MPSFFDYICCISYNSVHPESVSSKDVEHVKPIVPKAITTTTAAAGAIASNVGAVTLAPDGSKRITIVHFNDVYNIEPAKREPVGGASRFCTKVKSMKAECNPLVVFSGDAFNPSLLSTITLGAQMPPVLNEIGCHVACMGNHDFDFGTSNLIKLVKQCNFPWLMANILDAETKKPYAQAHATHIMDWDGVKVGFAGLVEEEWIETLGAVNLNELEYVDFVEEGKRLVMQVKEQGAELLELEYVDFVEEGKRLVKQLKEQGAELLVAITHMRVPNDRRLAAEVPEFHLVLGGHDHHYETAVIGDVTMVKEMTKIDVDMPLGGGRPKVTLTKIEIDGTIEEDPTIVDSFMGSLAGRMTEVIGHTAIDIDGRFTTVRTRESNLGNFVCDIIKEATAADCVMINGGTFRSDTIHPAGEFTLGDMVSILPMMDSTLVLEVTGAQLVQGLENSVCMYPKLEGRFAQVSVSLDNVPVPVPRKYKMATKTYVADGKDGYDVFKAEGGVLMPTAVRNHFRVLEVLNQWDPKVRVVKYAKHWSKNVMTRRSTKDLSALASADNVLAEADAMLDSEEGVPPPLAAEPSREHEPPSRSSALPKSGVAVIEHQYAIKPIVDGRIIILGE
eukprot:gene20484-27272_t